MALPSSGPLSINDIAVEFGGAVPHSLSEYYGVAAGVPGPGNPIGIDNFYGASNIPPPVARQFYSRYTGPGASTYGLNPTGGVLRNASARSNLSGTSATPSNTYLPVVTGQVHAINGGAYMYWWNPALYYRIHPSTFIGIVDTDLLCKLKIAVRASYGNGDTLGSSSHRTYARRSFGAGYTTIHSSSGSSTNSGLVSFTTTQTLQEYIDNNQYIEMAVYAHSGNTNNCVRTPGNGYFNLYIETLDFIL